MLGFAMLIAAIFLAGVLAGLKVAWIDAYYKGRDDARVPANHEGPVCQTCLGLTRTRLVCLDCGGTGLEPKRL